MKTHKELKFIHITKTGGTSIESAGKNQNIKWGKNHKEYKCRADNTKDYQQSWHDIITNECFQKKYDWFMVVRNPYARILSEYNCTWGGIGGLNITHTQKEMNDFLIDKIKSHYLTKKYSAKSSTGHYRVQSEYLITGSKLYILKFESLHSHFNSLMKLRKIKNVKLEKLNTANNNNNKRFTIKDFSKDLINLINSIYSNDFKNFGYEKIIIK